MDFEDEKFAELYEEIKSYYADEQIYKALISNPSEGMVRILFDYCEYLSVKMYL